MLYVFFFLGLFVIGGLTGMFLAALGVDVHVHDTYFSRRPLPLHHGGGVVMAYMGGIHFWWPKMTAGCTRSGSPSSPRSQSSSAST
jgi:cytochrome c oxidase subunit 1